MKNEVLDKLKGCSTHEDYQDNVDALVEEIHRLRRNKPEQPTTPESDWYRRKAQRFEKILDQLTDFHTHFVESYHDRNATHEE